MPLRSQTLRLPDQLIKNWVDGVLAFANLENVDNDAPKVFGVDSCADTGEVDELSSGTVLYHFVGGVARDGYGVSQAGLREVLNKLIEDGATPDVHRLTTEKIREINVHGSITYKYRHLLFQSVAQLQTHEQWWALGIATLLHAGLEDRLQQCGWANCSNYFVDWPGRKGQSKFYCCPEHQNNERQRRHREKQKRKRRYQRANQSMEN